MTPAAARAVYERMLGFENPEQVVLRRYTGTGTNRPHFDTAPVRARVFGYQPNEIVEGIEQGDRRVILLAQDLINAQFPLPIVRNDKLVVRGREANIEVADDSTRRVAGQLIAYELRIRG